MRRAFYLPIFGVGVTPQARIGGGEAQ